MNRNRKQRKKRMRTLLTAALACSMAVSSFGTLSVLAQEETESQSESVLDKILDPDVTAKPMARMWMADGGFGYALSSDPDADYTESTLDMMAATIKEMYDGGFGGVELTIIADITDIEGMDSYNIGFGSEAMVYTLMEALNTANNDNEDYKLADDEEFDGFIIDITVTAHWPPVLNTVDPNDDAQQQQASTTIMKLEASDLFELDENGTPVAVKSGEKLTLDLPQQRLYSQGAAAPFYFADKLVSVAIGKLETVEKEQTDFSGNVSTVTSYQGVYESFDSLTWEQGDAIASAGVPGYAYTSKDSDTTQEVTGADVILIDGNWGKRYLSENLGLKDVEVEENNPWQGSYTATYTYVMPADGVSVWKDEDGDGTPETELSEEEVQTLLNPTANGGILDGLDADYYLMKDGETAEVLTAGTIVYSICDLEANWGKEVEPGDEDYEDYIGADGTNVYAERENDVQYEYSVNVDDVLAYLLEQLGIESEDVAGAAMEHLDEVLALMEETSLMPVYRQGSGQIQSGGSKIVMYPTYFALDYFNEDGAQELIDFWEEEMLCVSDERVAGGKTMLELMQKNASITGVSALFEDSIEANYTTTAFSAGFTEEAEEILGYEVDAYLPAMLGDISLTSEDEETAQQVSRFTEDYNLVLGEMYETNHAEKLVAWAKETIGYNYRCQAYILSGLDVVNAALTIGIPEADNAGSGDGVRSLSTATTLKGDSFDGKEILSNEALTFGTNIQSQTVLSYVIARLNSDADDGITRIVLHGSPAKRAYDGYASAWPGLDWGFAGYNQRQTWWDDYSEVFSDYISTIQSLLQNGDSKKDFAVLTDKSKSFELSKGDTFFRFLNEGYDYNVLTEDTIARGNLALTTAENGDLILVDAAQLEEGDVEGACYKALVLNDVSCISEEAVAYIQEWAQAGFPVFILNSQEDVTYREYGTGLGDTEESNVDEMVSSLASSYENVYDLAELIDSYGIETTRSTYRVNHEFATNLETWSSEVQQAIIDTMEEQYLATGTYIRYDAGYVYNCYDMEAYGGTAASFWETASQVDTGDLVKGLHSTTKYDSQTGSYYYFLFNDTGEGASNQLPGIDTGVDITTELVMTGTSPYAYEIDPYNGTVTPLANYTAEEIGDGLYKITYTATVLKNDTAILVVKGADDTSEGFPEMTEIEQYTTQETANVEVEGWSLSLEVYSPDYEEAYQEWKAAQAEDADTSVTEFLNQNKDVDPTESKKTVLSLGENYLGSWKNFDWDSLDAEYQISALYGSVGKENLSDTVIGNGTYTTVLTLSADEIGDFNQLTITHNTDMVSAVYVNGVRYNPNQITSIVDIAAEDLKEGDNEISIVISSVNLGKNSGSNAYDTGLENVVFTSQEKVFE